MSRGRAWAYAGAGLGAVASVAANVAHSYVPPAGAGPGWQPWVGSVISAVFWPLALLVAVEVFSRIDWPAGVRWVVLRWLGLVPLMAVVAVVSYQHMSGLLAFHGAGWFERTVGPGGVDGLMVLCSAALVARTVHVAVVSPAHEPVPEPEPLPKVVPVSPEPLRLAPPVSPEPPVRNGGHRLDATISVPSLPVPDGPGPGALSEPGRVTCTAGCGRQVSLATYKRHKSKGCPAAAA